MTARIRSRTPMSSPLGLVICLTLLCVGSSPLAAQAKLDVREVTTFDGSPHEAIRIEGLHRWLHGPDEVKAGLGALEVRPSKERDYYGVTVSNLRGAAPAALVVAIHNASADPVRWLVRIRGFEPDPQQRRGQPYGYLSHDAPTGWSEFRIDLTAVRSKDGGRAVDCKHGLSQIRISRRKKSIDDPPLRIDHMRLEGEAPASERRKRLTDALRIEDLLERRREVRPALMALPDEERVTRSIKLLGDKDSDPSGRRAARDAIAAASSETAVKATLKALQKSKGALRAQLAWSLAAMPAPQARAAAMKLVKGKERAGVVTAIIQALGRHGMTDVSPLLEVVGPWAEDDRRKRPGRARSWPERAALIRALRTCASPDAVDGLIEILERARSVRVRFDAVDALTRLTGKDLGESAAAWRAWWKANPDAPLSDNGKRAKLPYATYYGIPVPPGRVGFVIDLSGSMREPIGDGPAADHVKRARHLAGLKVLTRLDLAREELIHAVEALPDGAFVHVVTYSDAGSPVVTSKGPQKATTALKKKLAKRLRALSAQGKTNIHDGLLRAYHPGRKPSRRDVSDGPDTLFLLTDGNPSSGPVTSRIELRDLVLEWNIERMIRIHTINLGARESRWLEQLARDTDGRFLELKSRVNR